jgi:hypothetical protein
VEVFGGLDALGQDDGPGSFVMGEHRSPGPGLLIAGPRLHQRQVELDDVGRDDVEQRERIEVGADVVEGDGEPVLAQGGDLASQRGGAMSRRRSVSSKTSCRFCAPRARSWLWARPR